VKAIPLFKEKGGQRRAVKDSMTSSKDVNGIIQRPPTPHTTAIVS